MPSFGASLVCGLLLTLITANVAQAEPPKRGLMLHSFGLEFGDLYARDVWVSPDLEGIPRDRETVATEPHAVTPMFRYTDASLGEGIVGWPLVSGEERGPPAGVGKYDWWELKRWHMSQSDAPSASTVLFREPAACERYRWQILIIAAVVVLEAALILSLLHDRRRRRRAEIDAHQRIAEFAELNRRATVRELSASVAHELTQPLSAISHNAEAAALILRAQSADLSELRDIVAGITRDQRCATQAIKRLRDLLGETASEIQEIDLNEAVREVFELLSATAAARHIDLSTSFAAQALYVSGDRIQLQQVILNLVINGIDSMRDSENGERKIIGCTALVDDVSAEVTIEDSGPGLPPDKAEQIFEPFFTSKAGGLGVGLSIARAIVESHRGRIWAENRRGPGAIFRFSLPLATRKMQGMAAQ